MPLYLWADHFLALELTANPGSVKLIVPIDLFTSLSLFFCAVHFRVGHFADRLFPWKAFFWQIFS